MVSHLMELSNAVLIGTRIRNPKPSTPPLDEMELVVRLALLPLRTLTIVNGICGQSGSTGRQSGD